MAYCLSVCGAGWLYDISQSYDYSFYMMGVCIIISGAMLYPIPCIQRWRLSHAEKEQALNRDTNNEEVALNAVTA